MGLFKIAALKNDTQVPRARCMWVNAMSETSYTRLKVVYFLTNVHKCIRLLEWFQACPTLASQPCQSRPNCTGKISARIQTSQGINIDLPPLLQCLVSSGPSPSLHNPVYSMHPREVGPRHTRNFKHSCQVTDAQQHPPLISSKL